jgi:hypothetical protein
VRRPGHGGERRLRHEIAGEQHDAAVQVAVRIGQVADNGEIQPRVAVR